MYRHSLKPCLSSAQPLGAYWPLSPGPEGLSWRHLCQVSSGYHISCHMRAAVNTLATELHSKSLHLEAESLASNSGPVMTCDFGQVP